jgi:hypothetical protein
MESFEVTLHFSGYQELACGLNLLALATCDPMPATASLTSRFADSEVAAGGSRANRRVSS